VRHRSTVGHPCCLRRVWQHRRSLPSDHAVRLGAS
jgi:hypothetical protein